MDFRIEHDTIGEVKVEIGKFWGAQTQRSLENFPIGNEKMPIEMIYAITMAKQAAARANDALGLIQHGKAMQIENACNEIIEGKHNDMFPLSVWQTGSGTQTNMNVNEVIAHIANLQAGSNSIHPNDDVNCSQSTNDVFPTAMHVAFILSAQNGLMPKAKKLAKIFWDLSSRYNEVYKTGRTHLQDAAPLTLGQEISSWAASLDRDIEICEQSIECLKDVPFGGTAVGTGLNTVEGFSNEAVAQLSEISGIKLKPSRNLFQGLSSKSEIAYAHATIKCLATDLLKIANDIRLLSSGPRSGIGEIKIPQNEPGSSIMPGKANPTQAEALIMVCVQAMANDTAVSIGSSMGNFQLNAMMPLIIYNAINTLKLLSDAVDSFADRCASGIEPNYERIEENLKRSLMLATALNPYVGYDNAAKIAKLAYEANISLKQAAVQLGILNSEEFDSIVDVKKMVGPSVKDSAK